MPGKLIVFEGLDGVGKGTQLSRLRERSLKAGIDCRELSFPRYRVSFYADLVARYLNGEFGDPLSITPYLSSLPYAMDRLEAKPMLETWLAQDCVVLLDRYVGSNVAHQSAKLDPQAVDQFQTWLCELEYQVHRLPREDLVLFLRLPPQIGFQRVADKRKRRYTRKRRDFHEVDLLYQETVERIFRQLARRLENWVEIDCATASGELLSEDTIADRVADVVARKLGLSL